MKGMRWLKKVVPGALAASVWLVAPTAIAGPFGLEGENVSDVALADMRGRFVDGRDVSFFGVVMATDWHRAGQNFSMELHMDISFSQGFRPNITIYRTRDLGVASNGVANQVLDGVSDNGALDDIAGVVQNIQIAGDENGVHNNVQWTVTDASGMPRLRNPDLVEIGAGQESFADENGVTTQINANGSGVGYQVDVPDVGTVAQRISRRQILSAGNILQSTQLNSNLNQVLNRIGLNVQLAPSGNLSGVSRNFQRALSNLQGL
ncbi:hypothetical protein [Aliamphritea ceti]|uniref:hypothetical protein n=1 Tax=Aliamphritea ceti TaxID=1524258 RepID=UPI0021C2B428|nr:hypothetical protein [Aliamphritea ceti]